MPPYDGAVSPRTAAVMATLDLPSDKPALRRLARARRDAVAPDLLAAAAAAAAARVDAAVLASLPAGATVAVYAAMRSELSCAPLAAAAAARGLAVAYPRTVDVRRLVFHQVAVDQLAPGRFDIPEPPADAPVIELDRLAVVVVPGLLFDRAGYRLGWGGGWYDATLAGCDALRVGLTLEQLLVDALPRAAHDQPMHLIATEVALHAGAPRAQNGP